MTDKQRSLCISEAQCYTNREAYISDLAPSSIWGDGPEGDIPTMRMEQLGSIYDAVHRSIKQIAADAGMSVRAIAVRFCIPQRTIENWSSIRECPLYTRLMMQECLGLLKR